MKISILTLFPEMFVGPFDHSIIKRAQEKQAVSIDIINIRDFGIGKHKMVDDTPFGGGIGMVLRVDVLHQALVAVKEKNKTFSSHRTILLSARGSTFHQQKAKELSDQTTHLILICGHYEGFDERLTHFVDEEISIGDFVTTGGEIPAMLITDAIVRLLPGVLKEGATESESFTLTDAHEGTLYLEYPQYTQPRVYRGFGVPDVLLSGNHAEIDKWRNLEAKKITAARRPDLIRSKMAD